MNKPFTVAPAPTAGRPLTAVGANAEQFLKSHYQVDDLDADQIRADDEHWNWVLGEPARFPNADLEFITQFSDAASEYLSQVPA